MEIQASCWCILSLNGNCNAIHFNAVEICISHPPPRNSRQGLSVHPWKYCAEKRIMKGTQVALEDRNGRPTRDTGCTHTAGSATRASVPRPPAAPSPPAQLCCCSFLGSTLVEGGPCAGQGRVLAVQPVLRGRQRSPAAGKRALASLPAMKATRSIILPARAIIGETNPFVNLLELILSPSQARRVGGGSLELGDEAEAARKERFCLPKGPRQRELFSFSRFFVEPRC